MNPSPYLCQRRGLFYFRRRIPRLSTYTSAVMVSLGTTDQKSAHRSCVQLTVYMDLMLDELADITLSDEALRSFMQGELRAFLQRLLSKRRLQHIDGSLTAAKLRLQQVEAQVLRSIVEHGLTDEIIESSVDEMSSHDQTIARDLHEKFYREFTSDWFTSEVEQRLIDQDLAKAPTGTDVLRARWAVIEGRMAAHSA
ncbi:DUF6538 domain-containing protein [uncultured Tateyamaria sp.]|uniref:DUF6538 domain-containing protein n=1 Tax=uncultured Tateyamaria sp. TaxID=455651 RepID=UPI00342B00A0